MEKPPQTPVIRGEKVAGDDINFPLDFSTTTKSLPKCRPCDTFEKSANICQLPPAAGREHPPGSPDTTRERRRSSIKNRFFIGCICLALAVALFTGVFAVMGWGSLLGDVGSAILYPFQWGAYQVGGAVSGFVNHWQDVDKLQAEVDSLRAENESLRSEIIDAAIIADEQSWLYRYLSMKEEHEDYHMCAATVISSTSAAGGGGAYVTEVTLNKGSTAGVAAGMPVVTTAGLVGVVVEVNLTHCRVSTLLHTSVSVGAITTRASEHGLCEGDHGKVHDGQATLRHLPEEADVAVEDIVVTSGRGSVYPYGIPIGRVVAVTANAYSRTTEATISPFVDFADLSQVVILTEHIPYTDSDLAPESSEAGGGS